MHVTSVLECELVNIAQKKPWGSTSYLAIYFCKNALKLCTIASRIFVENKLNQWQIISIVPMGERRKTKEEKWAPFKSSIYKNLKRQLDYTKRADLLKYSLHRLPDF